MRRHREHWQGGREQDDVARRLHRGPRPRDGLGPRSHRRLATSLEAAGGKDLEILGADVAGQCLQRGLVDEVLVYILPVLLGDGIRFTPPGLPMISLEPIGFRRSRDTAILRFRVRS